MKRSILSGLTLGVALLLAALIGPAAASAAGPISSTACSDGPNVTCNLWARTGTLSLPGSTPTIWGFSETAGGSPTLPGPTLIVDQGDLVTVNLTNNLSRPTSIVFGGQAMVPDVTGVAPGGTKAYTFSASQPGTYLYEAGLIPGSQYQVAMGLHGVLIIRPAGAPGQAYAAASTAFDDEALVVLEEIDPALNNSATPWTVDLRAFAPKFFLVNGRPYTSAMPSITTTAGNHLLLRYANAGIQHHSIGVLGLHQEVLAADGSQLPAPRSMVAETIAPGQSADVLVAVPATAVASTKYALYDAAMVLNNSNATGIGGMLALIDASATVGDDVAGPTTSGLVLSETAPGSGLFNLSADVSDAATGNATIAGAELRIDSATAAAAALSATDGSFDSASESVTTGLSPIDTTGWTSGTHTVYVRGRDALGNWGANVSAAIAIDRAGPTTSALALTPNPAGPSTSVALTGTASDVASGNNNVIDAEYWIGAPGLNGAGTHLTLNKLATVVSVTGTIPAQAANAVVSVHARDSAGNWGPYATANLTVDAAGPAVSGLTAAPPANNGSYGQSSGNPTVRLSMMLSDVASGGSRIATGEGFIDSAVVNGAGFPFYAADGTFDTSTELVYADVPLTTINALTTGNHTIRVHGKDAVGNWGAEATLTYLIDRTAPTFTAISLAPSPTFGAATVTLTVSGASDPLVGALASGVAGGEWWVGTAVPAAGTGTTFIGIVASIPTGSLPLGNDTIGVRIRDAAGNWSTATHTAVVQVIPDVILRTTFDTGNASWGWSGRSTTTTSRLSVNSAAAMAGARGLQARGNSTNFVQFNFGTTGNPASETVDARFYFNPRGNTSTGQDIFATAASGNGSNTFNTIRFRVRYRMSSGQSQVQIQVGSTANAVWTNLTNNAANRIEVVWQSGSTLQLIVNGVTSQTLSGAAGTVGAIRLGSVTSGGNSTLMYFDDFSAKRTVAPLIGTGP